MTKKDYIKFASLLKNYSSNTSQININTLAHDLSDIFINDNDLFNKETFFKYIGLELFEHNRQ